MNNLLRCLLSNKDDLSRQELDSQLPLLKPLCEVFKELGENSLFHDTVQVLSSLSVAERAAFSWCAESRGATLSATSHKCDFQEVLSAETSEDLPAINHESRVNI